MGVINYTIAVMIYNVESFLPDCLDSIVSQQGDDIEILLIDDGSTDFSGTICDDYAAKDRRIRAIHQKNSGVAAARNSALDNARGKWLIQVDGDDVLSERAVEKCRLYLDDNSDWLQFDSIPFSDISQMYNWKPKGEKIIIQGDALRDLHVQLIDHSATNTHFPTYNMNPAWGKAWNMEFVRRFNLYYDINVVKGEGTLFTFTCSYYAEKVTFVPCLIYGYRTNPSSIMHRFSGDILDNQSVQIGTYQRIISEHGESDDQTIQEALQKRSLYLIENAISLGIAHPDCNFKKREKKEFLYKLCDFQWVREAVDYASKNHVANRLHYAIQKRNISALLRYCAKLRMKIKLSVLIKKGRIEKAIQAVKRRLSKPFKSVV